ncbi:MAG: acetyl-CoA carboxylase biotin carboxyl carrier protein subunit, partial [Deltaproteobacteria bacterium]|nr:acetyl-CoA carboxylase biotin carboxyl carrier protein subunit [Deltaproteobacteria bacterium]
MKKKTFEISVGGKNYKVDVDKFDGKQALVKIDGKSYEVEVKKDVGAVSKPTPVSPPAPAKTTPAAPEAPQAPTVSAPSGGEVTAPMPGLILEIMVAVGDQVSAGMPVMKME